MTLMKCTNQSVTMELILIDELENIAELTHFYYWVFCDIESLLHTDRANKGHLFHLNKLSLHPDGKKILEKTA